MTFPEFCGWSETFSVADMVIAKISSEVRGILEDKNVKYFKAMTQDGAENVKLTF